MFLVKINKTNETSKKIKTEEIYKCKKFQCISYFVVNDRKTNSENIK